jgi:cyanophycin synthetase
VESFAANLDQSPGRFNLLEIRGALVVIDYGHNSSALLALVEAIEKLPHQKRTIVYSTAGDRRDCDIIRQGQLIGQNFDHAILFEDHYLRGRARSSACFARASPPLRGPRPSKRSAARSRPSRPD